jgi:tRNA(Ile)-lysidine synthase
LRRAREALEDAAQSFLAANSEMSEAGYALIDSRALASAPQEIALRALSRLISAVGGGEEPIRLAKLEALLAALTENPAKTHTLGRCRLEPFSECLGIFREVRAKGLPVARLQPGGRTLWDNRFRIELGSGEQEPIVVRALGDSGLRDLCDRSAYARSLPRLAGRTLPGCWRGEALVGIPSLGKASTASEPTNIDCRATFVSALWL